MTTPVLLFFDISSGELLVILLVAFIVFGPSRIPEVARKIGRGINEVRRASDEIKREISKEARKMESNISADDFDVNTPPPHSQRKDERAGESVNEKKPGPQEPGDKPGDDTTTMV